MIIKFSSGNHYNIPSPRIMLKFTDFGPKFYFHGWGWVAGLMRNKANLSKAELAAGCC